MNPLLICSFFAWLIAPVGLVAYHYGPGQDWQEEGQVAALVIQAEEAVADGQAQTAIERYREAIDKLPAGHETTAWRMRLEIAKTQLQNEELPEAHGDLKVLLDELLDARTKWDERDVNAEADDAVEVPEQLIDEARQGLASAQYYMTYLMRLEGRDRSDWEPEIEASRQLYRLLAETATDSGQKEQLGKDLEAAIRLQRADLDELKGSPIPKPCNGCCSCNNESKSKKKSRKKGKKPARAKKPGGRKAGLGAKRGIGS